VRIGSFGGSGGLASLVATSLLLGCAASLVGCAASPALRAAEAHDLAALARAVAAESERGELDAGDARDIAKAIAKHEVENAKGDDGARAIEAFGRCTRANDGAFEARARGTDEVAAAAALARLEEGLLSPDDARELSSRPGLSAGWRAVETRAMVRPDDGEARRTRMNDGDQAVRLAALRASAEAGDVADTDALIEAARLDPHPLARSLAVRAIGRTATGEHSVRALRDLWTQADENVRQSIADAWATERNIDAGGRRELLRAAESHQGSPSIAAAAALARWPGEGRDEAIGVLGRAIKSGTTIDRVFAIGVAPASEPSIAKALHEALDDKDDAVAVAAAWRKLNGFGRDTPADKERAALIAKLMVFAKTPTTRGFQAQKALARAGAREVLPLVEKQVTLHDTRARETTGVALVDLGELAKATRLVADADLGVRAAVACAILQAPKN